MSLEGSLRFLIPRSGQRAHRFGGGAAKWEDGKEHPVADVNNFDGNA